MILYLFLSCQKRLNKNYDRIVKMMNYFNYDKYIILTGGHNKNIYEKNHKRLKLKCNDNYEGLPEKMIKAYKFIYENNFFNEITFICKLDEDMILKKLLDIKSLNDYCGKINYSKKIERDYHIGKCSKNSKFNNSLYKGNIVPWCLGGHGYILSKKSLKILKDDIEYCNEIYEDLYIAKILNKNKIYPSNFKNIKEYFISSEYD